MPASAEPLGAQLDLRHRLLARHEQGGARLTDRPQRHEQQGRLPDARLAAEQDERRGDEPASEHTVELRDPGRDACSLLHFHVDEPERSARNGARTARLAAERLLDERAESGAAGALPEPAPGRVAALRATELNGRSLRLRHLPTLRSLADANRDEIQATSRRSQRGPKRSNHNQRKRPPAGPRSRRPPPRASDQGRSRPDNLKPDSTEPTGDRALRWRSSFNTPDEERSSSRPEKRKRPRRQGRLRVRGGSCREPPPHRGSPGRALCKASSSGDPASLFPFQVVHHPT